MEMLATKKHGDDHTDTSNGIIIPVLTVCT